jgi:hypothetical protein
LLARKIDLEACNASKHSHPHMTPTRGRSRPLFCYVQRAS